MDALLLSRHQYLDFEVYNVTEKLLTPMPFNLLLFILFCYLFNTRDSVAVVLESSTNSGVNSNYDACLHAAHTAKYGMFVASAHTHESRYPELSTRICRVPCCSGSYIGDFTSIIHRMSILVGR